MPSERPGGAGAARAIGLALLAVAGVLSSAAAQAELIDIAWGEQGGFERRVTVAPGRFAEVCGKLAQGSEVAWRFDASAALDFNIHYHEGKNVHYPARQDATAAASGRLQGARDQDYCWMWTNPSGSPVQLQLRLQLAPQR